jgi:TPR repeat protein
MEVIMPINPVIARSLLKDAYEYANTTANERHGQIRAGDIFLAVDTVKERKEYQDLQKDFFSSKKFESIVALYKQASINLPKKEMGKETPLARLGEYLVLMAKDSPTGTRAAAKIAKLHFNGESNILKDLKIWVQELFRSLILRFSKLPQKDRKEFITKIGETEREIIKMLSEGKSATEIEKDIRQKLSMLKKEIAAKNPPKEIEVSVNEEIDAFSKEGIEYLKTLCATPAILYSVTETPATKTTAADLCMLAAKNSGKSYLKELCAEYAKKPNARDLNELMYQVGKGISKDDTQAFQLCLESAKAGNPKAQYYTGRMYELGKGITKDASEAQNWYNLAISQLEKAPVTDGESQFILGMMYEEGKGCTKDHEKATEKFDAAASAGSVDALFLVSTMQDLSHVEKMASMISTPASTDLNTNFVVYKTFKNIETTLSGIELFSNLAKEHPESTEESAAEFDKVLQEITITRERLEQFTPKIEALKKKILNEAEKEDAAGDPYAAIILSEIVDGMANKWFEKAAARGYKPACLALSMSYAFEGRDEEAMKLIEKGFPGDDEDKAFGLELVSVIQHGMKKRPQRNSDMSNLEFRAIDEKFQKSIAENVFETAKKYSENSSLALLVAVASRDVSKNIEEIAKLQEKLQQSFAVGSSFLRAWGLLL